MFDSSWLDFNYFGRVAFLVNTNFHNRTERIMLSADQSFYLP